LNVSMKTVNTQLCLNDFANRSFRDMADQDYIAARLCYRRELDQQFLWNSLQAIEKYLKAILLFNGKSAKNLRHNLGKALQRVEEIEDIRFEMPVEARHFILEYLDKYGENRYLDSPSYLRGSTLLDLDRTVWNVRRFCYFMRAERGDGTKQDRFEIEVEKVHCLKFQERPHEYKISGGYLEKILQKNLPGARDLVWKNFYFGRRKKHTIPKFRVRNSSVNPTHFLHPECFPILNKIVDFPKSAVRDYFKKKACSW